MKADELKILVGTPTGTEYAQKEFRIMNLKLRKLFLNSQFSTLNSFVR